ncbi:hypothetical protein HPP92_003598 [Vanilla planifolia]|uniref:Uncharacterized protein n=1 Tax=Vanilla planifolia TaxID=51239 RepID=A0A835RW39_VANPL|nr:hypothetical protein HPP92_003985 [Vanilla planifolia]KAG0503526.1 hypothetical protein HPP92_003598 [Vanilla planifolia]
MTRLALWRYAPSARLRAAIASDRVNYGSLRRLSLVCIPAVVTESTMHACGDDDAVRRAADAKLMRERGNI